MTAPPRVGVLGGTFDPIHLGHIAIAHTSQRTLGLDRVRFVPSGRPPHRTDSPRASGYHRIEMIRRAIAEAANQETGWEVSDLELQRNGPSYTYDTLAELHREGFTPLQIFFITGADAFADVATWHRYPEVLDAAHFVVVTRPGTTLASLRERLPSLIPRMMVPADFIETAETSIILLEADTPDVSSTDIRRRAGRGESLTGLVPSSVAAYISEQSLYRTAFASPKRRDGRDGGPVAPGV